MEEGEASIIFQLVVDTPCRGEPHGSVDIKVLYSEADRHAMGTVGRAESEAQRK